MPATGRYNAARRLTGYKRSMCLSSEYKILSIGIENIMMFEAKLKMQKLEKLSFLLLVLARASPAQGNAERAAANR